MPDADSGTPAAAAPSSGAFGSYALYERFPRLRWGRPDIPATMVGAYWGVLAAAAFGVLSGLGLQTCTSWYQGLRQTAVDKSIANGDNPPLQVFTDAQVREVLRVNLIAMVVAALLLALIAHTISRGRASSRWTLTAVWALATLGVLPGVSFLGLPQGISLVATRAPLLMSVPSALGAIAFVFAFGSLLSPPSRRFFAAQKAAQVEAAGLGGTMPSRAPAGPRPGLPGLFGRRGGFQPGPADADEPEADFPLRKPRPGADGARGGTASKGRARGDDPVSLAKADGDSGAPEQGGSERSAAAGDGAAPEQGRGQSRRRGGPRAKSRASGARPDNG
ncbi:MAG: hypothetical protein LBQ06_04420 [Frankiaceae bacterium]|jgi:hypothetical protein|nr:hypothetical protein [Frankiaceae bacterium]